MSTRVRLGDLLDHFQRLPGPVDEIVIHRDPGHVGRRVSVADREYGPLVLDRPLDEASPRGEVHDVVLVDPRRAAEQRGRVDLRRLRRVLQQFHQVVAIDDLGGRGREVLSDGEFAGVNLPGTAVVVEQVVGEVVCALSQARAAGFDGAFKRGGVGQQEIGRGECVHHQPGQQACFRLLDSLEPGRGDQLVHELGERLVVHPQRVESRVLRPGAVGEAAILRVELHGRRGRGSHPARQRDRGYFREVQRVAEPCLGHVGRVFHRPAEYRG